MVTKTTKMMEASFFETLGAPASTKNLYDLLGEIQSGRYAMKISTLRKLVENNDPSKDDYKKKNLPSFTPSGVFCKSHSKADLQSYNPLIVLDIDKVGLGKANELKQQVSEMDTTFVAFISPSGDGLKILVKNDATAGTHEEVFRLIADYYEAKLGVKIDRSGKDLSRLCFVSYDPELFLNEKSVVWQNTSTEIPLFSTCNVSVTTTDLFSDVVNLTDQKFQYLQGNRNNYLHLLANNLNRAGVCQTEALSFISTNYPDMVSEIPPIVKRAYAHLDDHGKYTHDYLPNCKIATTATPAISTSISGTPLIPDSVYENLPQILRKGATVFDVKRERDVFFTGALTILSNCFNDVLGLYDKREVHSNLFCFVIAPPASGKGVLNFARDMAQEIHDSIKNDFYKALRAEDEYSKMRRKFFISADSSAAAVKRDLLLNNGVGCICETEADTLSATLQQDWGGYSEVIRNAFQHEKISFNRIGRPDEVNSGEILDPQLSICLSGTPSQVPSLLKSTADGLFSRFIFYTYQNNQIPYFKNVFSRDGERNLKQYFKKLAEEVLCIYSKIKEKGNINFQLKEQQEDTFVQIFDKTVKRLVGIYGDETKPMVNRLGLITFRIAMILSILRSIENNCLNSDIQCNDVDFETSIALSEVYLVHSLEVYKTLPGSNPPKRSAEILLENLPDQFTYSEAKEIGINECKFKERSISYYLKELVSSGRLLQPQRNGEYFKPSLQ